jgi:hypothetical protein
LHETARGAGIGESRRGRGSGRRIRAAQARLPHLLTDASKPMKKRNPSAATNEGNPIVQIAQLRKGERL